ncbi:MAG: prephenate dehydrogenase [Bacillus thermozeamaize]|uniref:Prephenate dehydrogenase n=1 Tax=Bacillus thermozeamaize TaxID=230954 RepID=A0A1Y3PQQ3_9BACI|nr:MAG: prephenate dehydrogenase [Bacillus thermozeamaize]
MIRVAILGVGLIGGSLALSLQHDEKQNIRVTGYDLDPSTLMLAQQLGIIHHGTMNLHEATAEADFIFLCTPVDTILHLLKELANLPLKPGCIISDTGSTKTKVVETGVSLLGKERFIGGHPMAGSHRSGVEAASDRLFENAFYVLTPHPDTPESSRRRLMSLLAGTRATLVEMAAEEHDQVVGLISHLPHIIAAALVRQVARHDQENQWYSQLAAGGFRDLTRIASSNPIMWRDILLQNGHVLLQLLDEWQWEIARIKRLLAQRDEKAIYHFFDEARTFREQIPERKKGILPPLYECYVDIPDRPGIIGEVATILGDRQINLTNIQIIENRADIPGVLRLSFRQQEDLEKAIEALQSKGFQVYRR